MTRLLQFVFIGLLLLGAQNANAQLVGVSSGPTVNVFDVTSGSLDLVSSTSIPSAGLPAGFQIFAIKQHPTTGVIYTSAANSCFDGDLWCWGSARIDKFQLTGSTLSHIGPAYIMDNAAFLADGINCAEGDELFTGYPGQEGFCQPTNFVFSADGSRLYIDDDELDGIQIFAVDPGTGNLSFLSEGASTSNHGLAYLNDRLYNGSTTISVAGDTPVEVFDGDQGNATEVLPDGTLVSGISNQRIEAFDLTDPDAPALIDSLNTGGASALDTARSDDASFFLLSGRELLTSVSWDGSAFTQLDQISTPAVPGGANQRNNRHLDLVDLGPTVLAVVSYFEAEDDVDYGTRPTGVELWSVDTATGAFAQVDDQVLGGGWSRDVLVLGPAPAPTPVLQSVPVNSNWALILMISVLLMVAAVRLRVH